MKHTFVILMALVMLAACAPAPTAMPLPIATATATSALTPTLSPTPLNTPTPPNTPTSTTAPSPSATATPMPTDTPMPTPTKTKTLSLHEQITQYLDQQIKDGKLTIAYNDPHTQKIIYDKLVLGAEYSIFDYNIIAHVLGPKTIPQLDAAGKKLFGLTLEEAFNIAENYGPIKTPIDLLKNLTYVGPIKPGDDMTAATLWGFEPSWNPVTSQWDMSTSIEMNPKYLDLILKENVMEPKELCGGIAGAAYEKKILAANPMQLPTNLKTNIGRFGEFISFIEQAVVLTQYTQQFPSSYIPPNQCIQYAIQGGPTP